MYDQKQYWIGLNLVKGIGPVRIRSLINHFGSAREVWEASHSELLKAGLSKKIAGNLIQLRGSLDFSAIQDRIKALNVNILTWEDPEYPKRLREIPQSPPVIYVIGRLEEVDQWAVAIVGTRRATQYGHQVAEEIATYLAQNGVTIVSGLARGIDSIAHRAAVNAGGRTIAVLGSGVDWIYPPENRRLADLIKENGAIISDYPIGTKPDAVNFPPRNRIISGLSLAVIVVEAGEKSGALITADFAADQGREVFSVPGSILMSKSKGTNLLIQQGAKLLLHPSNVLESLDLTSLTQYRKAWEILPANEVETILLDILGRNPQHIDEICVKVDLPMGEISATLAMMELKGMVRQLGGMNYISLMEIQEDYSVNSGKDDLVK